MPQHHDHHSSHFQPWDIVNNYFSSNRYRLTQHQLQSYNDFITIHIPRIITYYNTFPQNEVSTSTAANKQHVYLFTGMTKDDVINQMKKGSKERCFKPTRWYIAHQTQQRTVKKKNPPLGFTLFLAPWPTQRGTKFRGRDRDGREGGGDHGGGHEYQGVTPPLRHSAT